MPDGVTLVRSTHARDTVERLKRELAGPLDIGGADLAASLLDLVDEFAPYVMPVAGGGTPYWPTGHRIDLRLVDQQRFDSGAVGLRYRRAD